jgi:dihydroorotate dehydrogenase
MYNLIKPILFSFDPEDIHKISFKLIPFIPKSIKKLYLVEDKVLNKELFGIKFKNPVGLAAGLDKDGLIYNHLSDFGFGFVEIGTVTPLKQIGNEKPRLYRLLKDNALINRMGFNNKGIYNMINNLDRNKNKSILGINVGKNKLTENKNAYIDYIYCISKLEKYADYFTINISSPNTPNLRELQKPEDLKNLLLHIVDYTMTEKPLILKISPDINNKELEDIVKASEGLIDGFIATNTTIDRDNIDKKYKSLAGGLSGLPLRDKSTDVIYMLNKLTELPIIGSGGIMSVEDANEKIDAGADLIQIYTGFIYKGPKLIKDINESLRK